MEAITGEKLEGMLRKVQALLTQADHPNTDPTEANIFRDKAEALMYRYRIDEAMLAQAQPAGLEIKPKWGEWFVCGAASEFKFNYTAIARYVMDHVGIRGVFQQRNVIVDERPAYTIVAYSVGYESDLRIAEALFTSCMLAFQQKLEPRYDPSLSDQENAYNMRSAGMEGWRIAQAIFGSTEKKYRPKARALFKAEAIKRGEDPSVLLGKGNSMLAYREDFASGFAHEIYSRLSQMRMSRQDEEKGELVLASRNERINEEFYSVYPQYRPAEVKTTSTVGSVDPRTGCAKCAKAKSGYCRDHTYLKPRYVRGGRRYNYAAQDRGRQAARSVDLGGTPSGSRLPSQPKGELG